MRALVLCAVLATGLALGATRAGAEPPEAGSVDSRWVGRYCTPDGCAGAPSAAAQAASFGAAAGTIVFLARRRRA